MRREQLEHLIRAATEIADDEIVIFGSQAILAEHPDAPGVLLLSMEADVYAVTKHPDATLEIAGALGEGSRFQETYGYWAHALGPETPRAPAGWQHRLVEVRNANTLGRAGWCMETHDLVLAATRTGGGRRGAAQRLRRPDVLRERLPTLPIDPRTRVVVQRQLEANIQRLEAR